MDNSKVKEIAEKCLRDEAEALLGLIPQLDEGFEKAVDMMYHCCGHVIVTGVGKSGHVGAKMAATLASTGTPSFFLNAQDALHGDLGMITDDAIVVMISNSGNSVSSSSRRNGIVFGFVFFSFNRSTSTTAMPCAMMPSLWAAARDKSTILPRTNGPRSFTRTMTSRPFAGFFTRSRVPNGNVRWAQVILSWWSFSPLAVRRPPNLVA